MEPKAPTFTPYDFLGYIVPGFALMCLMDVSYLYHVGGGALTYSSLTGRYMQIPAASYIPLTLFAYFLGHLVSFVSSLLLEKHASWLHGRPAHFLMYGPNKKYLQTSGSNPCLSKIIRILVFLLLYPVTFADWVIKKLGISENYTKELEDFVHTAAEKALEELGVRLRIDLKSAPNQEPWGDGVERLALHCSLEAAPNHVANIRNYVVLYGFLRAMSFLMIVVTWTSTYHLFRYCHLASVYCLVISILLACASYGAFLKFWTRYHREVLMSMIALYAHRKKEPEDEKLIPKNFEI